MAASHPLLYLINKLITMEREFLVIWWLINVCMKWITCFILLIYLIEHVTVKRFLQNESYMIWLQWHAFLYMPYLMWSYEVNHNWPDMKLTVNHSVGVSVCFSQTLEMAKMICSIKQFIQTQCLRLLTVSLYCLVQIKLNSSTCISLQIAQVHLNCINQ